jgi:hypothetical protein
MPSILDLSKNGVSLKSILVDKIEASIKTESWVNPTKENMYYTSGDGIVSIPPRCVSIIAYSTIGAGYHTRTYKSISQVYEADFDIITRVEEALVAEMLPFILQEMELSHERI